MQITNVCNVINENILKIVTGWILNDRHLCLFSYMIIILKKLLKLRQPNWYWYTRELTESDCWLSHPPPWLNISPDTSYFCHLRLSHTHTHTHTLYHVQTRNNKYHWSLDKKVNIRVSLKHHKYKAKEILSLPKRSKQLFNLLIQSLVSRGLYFA